MKHIKRFNEAMNSKPDHPDHWKLNPVQKKKLEESEQILNDYPEYRDKAYELIDEIEKGFTKPFNIKDNYYKGDVFYDEINRRVKEMGAFSTPKQKEVQNSIYDFVVGKLRENGFYIHS